MGQSSSTRRRQDYYSSYAHHNSPMIPSNSGPYLVPPPPPQQPSPPPAIPPTVPPNFAFPENGSYPSPRYSYPAPPPHFCSSYHGNAYRYTAPFFGQPVFPHYPNQGANSWARVPPPSSPHPVPQQLPVLYMDHKETMTVKNVVNVHKETIQLELDLENPDSHLVSFTFDAEVDGSITIYYFCKEEENGTFSPQYPYITPVTVAFQKGPAQKFVQPSGTGIDMGFIELDMLSKPVEEVYPLTVFAKALLPQIPGNEQFDNSFHCINAQITQAVIGRKNDGSLKVSVSKQSLWANGVRYQLHDIFGIASSLEDDLGDESGKECVICMTEPRDTTVMPCRHMCMCSECAKELRLQSNKCPICRQPAEQLIEIKMRKEDG